MSYRTERLYVAMNKLASGTGTIRERFEEAYSLGFSSLDPTDFPEDELLRQFQLILSVVKDVLQASESDTDLGSAMDALSEHQIQELAEELLSLFQRTVQLDVSSSGGETPPHAR